MEKDGALYLFTLRLVPAFPFFVINLVMGLTPMRDRYLLLGEPARHAARHDRLCERRHSTRARSTRSHGILSPGLLISFALLGLFPAGGEEAGGPGSRHGACTAKWAKPRTFDRNLIVIGAGSAGLVSAYIAAAVKAKVTLIEKHRMGGDCLLHRLRAVQGADPIGQLLANIRRSAATGHPDCERRLRLRRRHGARATRASGPSSRTTRRSAIAASGGRMHPRRGADHLALVGGGYHRRRQAAT